VHGEASLYERPLTARFLIVQAVGTFRARLGRILLVAVAIGAVASLLDAAFDAYVEHIEGDLPGTLVPILVGLALLVTGANSFGSTFLAGVLDKTVGEHQHGHRSVGLGELFRTLPYLTLIAADLMVTFLRAAGWLLLLVPGVIVLTLTAITGPVIIIEGRGPVAAIRRSKQLIRPVFWLALRAVTIPILAEGLIDAGLTSLPFAHGLAGHLVVALCLEVPLAAFVALIEVTLAYHLIERDVRAGGFEPPRHEDTGT
jgi:hypothetical protein